MEAKVTSSCSAGIGVGSGVDSPCYLVVNFVIFQCVDVFAQGCAEPILLMSEVSLVLIISFFECPLSESKVVHGVCVCLHFCLVHNRLGKAFTSQWTLLSLPVVAEPFLVILGWFQHSSVV